MDTTKLVVGQIVWMQSGPHREKGRVLWITDKYIGVGVLHGMTGGDYRYAFLFDFNGKTGTVWEGLGSVTHCGGESWVTDNPFAPGTVEYGPLRTRGPKRHDRLGGFSPSKRPIKRGPPWMPKH
jgi:hypothetical protein